MTGAVVVVGLLLAGCGGDDDSADDGGAEATSDDSDESDGGGDATGDDGEATSDDSGGSDDAVPVGTGTATVTVDGVTMLFEQVEPGPDDDYYTFCTQVSGTLQAVFPQVDESGNVLQGELSVILIEPGTMADDIGEPPELSVHNGERFWNYDESGPIDMPADGRSASGTATVLESGAMNAETGEIDTTPFEATLEMSC